MDHSGKTIIIQILSKTIHLSKTNIATKHINSITNEHQFHKKLVHLNAKNIKIVTKTKIQIHTDKNIHIANKLVPVSLETGPIKKQEITSKTDIKAKLSGHCESNMCGGAAEYQYILL